MSFRQKWGYMFYIWDCLQIDSIWNGILDTSGFVVFIVIYMVIIQFLKRRRRGEFEPLNVINCTLNGLKTFQMFDICNIWTLAFVVQGSFFSFGICLLYKVAHNFFGEFESR